MSTIVTFVAFNFIIQSTKIVVVFVKHPTRLYGIIVFIMILGIFIATYVLGVSTLCIGSTIYGFMAKIIARKTKAKKILLYLGVGGLPVGVVLLKP